MTGNPADAPIRCSWAGTDPRMIAYHDHEWGVPVRDDRDLFERLMLECFQAGLSWSTILYRRDTFAAAFDGWDPERIASYGEADVARLLADPGIIRNRLKVAAMVTNAQAYLRITTRPGAFSDLVWSVTGDEVIDRQPAVPADVPATTPESDALSKLLKRHGFRFVGSTICYAFMQSVGMANDHLSLCICRK